MRPHTECAILDPVRLKLLIVDDHEEFRVTAGALLSNGRFELAGDAPDGESAIEAVEVLHPDVVLLDVQLPGIDGIEVAHRLALMPDAPDVVLMSARKPSDYGTRLTEAPACGFIPKHQLSGATLSEVLGRT